MTEMTIEWTEAIAAAAGAIARKEDLGECDVVPNVRLRVRKGNAEVQVRREGWESFGRTQSGMLDEATRLLESGRLGVESERPRRAVAEAHKESLPVVVIDDGEGEEEATKEVPRLAARDAVLVAIVRDGLSRRAEITTVAAAFSSDAAVSKALCPRACDTERGGHGMWTLEDGVYGVTTEGKKVYAALLGDHPSLDSTAAPVAALEEQEDVVLEAREAPNTLETMLASSAAATDGLNLELSYVSATKLHSDATNTRFSELYNPGDLMTEVLATVETELSERDFKTEAAEKSGELATVSERQSNAKRAFEDALAELMAATEASNEAISEAKRRRGV